MNTIDDDTRTVHLDLVLHETDDQKDGIYKIELAHLSNFTYFMCICGHYEFRTEFVYTEEHDENSDTSAIMMDISEDEEIELDGEVPIMIDLICDNCEFTYHVPINKLNRNDMDDVDEFI